MGRRDLGSLLIWLFRAISSWILLEKNGCSLSIFYKLRSDLSIVAGRIDRRSAGERSDGKKGQICCLPSAIQGAEGRHDEDDYALLFFHGFMDL